MTIAAGERATVADQELQAAIARVKSLLPDYRVAEFEAAQTAWERYREAMSGYAYSEYKGGTLAPMVGNIEFERVTRERIDALAEHVESMEIDTKYQREND